MRVESSVTSISWIPSEAIDGMLKMPFEMGISHYDEVPPDQIGAHGADLAELCAADRFRFANNLRVAVEFDDGVPVSWEHLGESRLGSTTLRLGRRSSAVPAVALDQLRPDPEIGDGWIRFAQTDGGYTGVPQPRRVSHPPFVKYAAPFAWTTLALTLYADGTSSFELAGASPFPRHWVYDEDGVLTMKSGVVDFKQWYRHAFGKHSPWGDEDSPALATAVERSLERELSRAMMSGEPSIRKLKEGDELICQGDEGTDVMLVLDGVVGVAVDGEAVAELGPGAVIGERAALEGGRRTSTVTAVTRCRIAVAPVEAFDRDSLVDLSTGHHAEDV